MILDPGITVTLIAGALLLENSDGGPAQRRKEEPMRLYGGSEPWPTGQTYIRKQAESNGVDPSQQIRLPA